MRVAFHRLAEDEGVRAARRLGRTSAALRGRFEAAVADATARVIANPGVGSPIHVDYRWVKVKRFRFLMYYRQTAPDLVVVYADAHSSRRAGYWLRRTRVP